MATILILHQFNYSFFLYVIILERERERSPYQCVHVRRNVNTGSFSAQERQHALEPSYLLNRLIIVSNALEYFGSNV